MTLKQIEPSDVLGDNYYIYNLTASDYTPSLNSTITITCTLKNIFGSAASGVSLTLYKNGSSVSSATTNSSGVATWTNISCTSAGMQNFSIKDRCVLVFVDNKISKSSTSGLVKNDGTIDTTSYSTFSGNYSDLSGKPTIPSDVSDLTDTNNTTFTPKSHTHGNLTNDGKVGTNANYIVVTGTGGAITSVQKLGNITYDGKVGTNANYFVYTTTSGQVTSKQKIGNITTSGAIGSTSGLPIITTTSGVLTTGSFGTSAGSFCEGNDSRLSDSRTPTSHTHGNISNDGKIGSTANLPVITTTGGALTTGSFGSSSGQFAEGNHTHSGYASSTHTHGNLQSNGQVGSTAQANKNVVTNSSGLITTEDKPTIPTAVSDLTNDSDFTTIDDMLEYISENATLTIPTTGADAGYLVLTIQ